MQIEAYLEQSRRDVDAALVGRFAPDADLPGRLGEALAYTVAAGGKRIRAALVFAAGEMFGSDRPALLPIGCAVEMVHACSLILDDLPSMDDAPTRRGNPAHHRVFGEGVSILAAVGLLNQSFRLLADAAGSLLVGRLARAVGPDGMISGQYADLHPPADGDRLESLEFIHSRKTGRLFIASAELGALAAGAGPDEVDALGRYAKNLGLAFQITDDLLDRTGTPERLAKPVGQDQNKLTFVSLCGPDGARQLAGELIDTAAEALVPFGPRAERLQQLAGFVRQRDR